MSRTIDEIKADIEKLEQAMLNPNKQHWARIYENTLLEHYKGELRLSLTADIPLDRLEEICTAERNGRCEVLPCKVGDTITTEADLAGLGTMQGMPFTVTGICLELFGDWGMESQYRTISLKEAEATLAKEGNAKSKL